nr:hypothetical protein [Staphylococcus delphini]
MDTLYNGLKEGGAILMPQTAMPPQFRELPTRLTRIKEITIE